MKVKCEVSNTYRDKQIHIMNMLKLTLKIHKKGKKYIFTNYCKNIFGKTKASMTELSQNSKLLSFIKKSQKKKRNPI